MKKLLFFLFCLSIFNLKSQISITSTNMPVSGDTCRYSNASLTSIGDYTTTGASWLWDFSALDSTGQDIRKFVPSSVTPYGFYFAGKYGEKTLDEVPIPSIPGFTLTMKNIYSFYKKNGTASFNAEGVGVTISNIPIGASPVAGNDDELYVFPLNYMNRDSTTFSFSTPTATIIPFAYKKHGYRITEVDGFGTITTPYGTDTCIRVVTTQYAIDSLIVNAAPAPFNRLGFPNYVRSYQWLTRNEKIPYLEISGNMIFGAFIPTQARYRDIKRNFVGIKEEALSLALSVFPNPSTHDLTVITPKYEGSIKAVLTDMHGKLVFEKTLDNNSLIANQHRLDVSSLSKGLYILNLSHLSGKQSLKISIQ
ncbi:MAG: hypothetical protein K0S26_2895 [Bacteroidota bacterium]|jgi:hypothetical protein|nr:hypothetical protein [Bacteroidota bacterium]